jgi:hypothetical protein
LRCCSDHFFSFFFYFPFGQPLTFQDGPQ